MSEYGRGLDIWQDEDGSWCVPLAGGTYRINLPTGMTLQDFSDEDVQKLIDSMQEYICDVETPYMLAPERQ